MNPTQVQLLGMATELSATLEEILDVRSQYGRASADEPKMLKRCQWLAQQIEASLKPEEK